jgi:hypothetical protein
MLLAMAERRLGVADRLARCFPDRRDPARITHTLFDMIRARIFAVSCGYEQTLMISIFCAPIPLQARLREAARYGLGPVFAADVVAAGECTFVERRDPPHMGAR